MWLSMKLLIIHDNEGNLKKSHRPFYHKSITPKYNIDCAFYNSNSIQHKDKAFDTSKLYITKHRFHRKIRNCEQFGYTKIGHTVRNFRFPRGSDKRYAKVEFHQHRKNAAIGSYAIILCCKYVFSKGFAYMSWIKIEIRYRKRRASFRVFLVRSCNVKIL